jgi:hypothetical protein
MNHLEVILRWAVMFMVLNLWVPELEVNVRVD